MTTAILLMDVYSTFRPTTQYGKKGEKVKVVKDISGILIVENAAGKRYSVKAKNVSYEKV